MNREELIELLISKAKEGKIVVENEGGLTTIPIESAINQHADGLLYDLNRDEATCLSFIDKPTWINNYACAIVIKALKKKIDELEKGKEDAQKAVEIAEEEIREKATEAFCKTICGGVNSDCKSCSLIETFKSELIN